MKVTVLYTVKLQDDQTGLSDAKYNINWLLKNGILSIKNTKTIAMAILSTFLFLLIRCWLTVHLDGIAF